MLKSSIIFARLLPLVFYLISSLQAGAQVSPQEGSILNYIIVGFSFQEHSRATQYVVELAQGNFTDDKRFAAHIIRTMPTNKNRLIIEVPSFGSEYTWRVTNKDSRSVLQTSRLYHFSTGNIPENPTNMKRLRVDSNSRQYPDGYIVFDGSNTMFDMNGRAVWYLPDMDILNSGNDVKVTSSGTMTFIAEGNAYDVSYSGKILWSAKGKSGSDNLAEKEFSCHHELKKLGSGHFMTLVAQRPDGAHKPKSGEKRVRFFNPMSNGKLVEFDEKGNIVWSWESAKYVNQSDIWELQQQYPQAQIDMHENAFYFDEKNKVVYLGLSNIGRILKIEYPSGKVLAEYGIKFIASEFPPRNDSAITVQQLFCSRSVLAGQHAITGSEDGDLYVYNNNMPCGMDRSGFQSSYPRVMKMKQVGDSLQNVWDFDCRSVIRDMKKVPGGGGNVVELPDNFLFVSMCDPYSDMFIVNTKKDIVWSAIAESSQQGSNTWVRHAMYRASFVSREQLEQLIWANQ